MMDSTPEKQPLLPNYSATESQTEEPSLSQLRDAAAKAQRDYMRAWSKSTNRSIPRLIMILTTTMLTIIFSGAALMMAMDILDDDLTLDGKVPLEAHIMSKCPDARDCLKEMILPAMIKVSDKVDFKLSYIGSVTDHDDGVLCKHGPQECLGNILELCAAKLYSSPMIYLGFTMCLSKNYQDIPKQDLVEDCALEHGLNFEKLNACATEDDGMHSVEMLQDSFKRSSAANVTTSCTVRVAGKTFCVRDGGEWKDCPGGTKPQDLVDTINRIYE